MNTILLALENSSISKHILFYLKILESFPERNLRMLNVEILN
jgi:hypothetical protein